MKKPDPFASPKRQLKRAKDKFNRLKRSFDTFVKNVECTQVIEPDTDGVSHLVKVRLNRRFPARWDEVAHEAIVALRSVLDQAGYCAAITSGKVAPKKTQFPVSDDLQGLNNLIGRKVCNDLPDEILSVFLSFQPHKGGNELIWTLNKLRHSLHTVLTPMSLMTGGMSYLATGVVGTVEFLDPVWESGENKIVIARMGKGAEFHHTTNVQITIEFGEIDICKGTPAFAVFRAMAAEVEAILQATEAECRRLGFIT